MTLDRVTAMKSRAYNVIAPLSIPAVAVCLWSTPAYAYIDGGTASMIFQMLIAGGLAAVVTLKVFWSRVKLFLTSVFSKKVIR